MREHLVKTEHWSDASINLRNAKDCQQITKSYDEARKNFSTVFRGSKALLTS